MKNNENCNINAIKLKDTLDRQVNQILETLKNSEYEQKMKDFLEKYREISKEETVRIVFAGEWSTGKSMIIRALTGDDSIKSGEGVVTHQVKSYAYHGVYLVDTPGLLSGNENDIRIAKQEIENADILVYCITSELFSDSSLSEFMEFMKFKDNYGRIILAITKIDREKTKESQWEIAQRYLDDVEKTLNEKKFDYDDIDLICFSARQYIDGKEEKNSDIIKQSMFTEFIDLINEDDFDESLSLKKCKRQAETIKSFIKETLKSMHDLNHCSEDIENKKRTLLYRIQQAHEKSSHDTKCIYSKTSLELLQKVTELIKLDSNEDDVQQLNDVVLMKLQQAFDEAEEHTNKNYESVYQEVYYQGFYPKNSELSDFNPKGKLKVLKQKKDVANLDFLESFFVQAVQAAKGIRVWAEPVKIGTTGHLWWKKPVMSGFGDPGTKLYEFFASKCGKNGASIASKISPKLGKAVDKFIKHSNKIPVAFAVIDIIFSIKNEVDEQKRYNLIEKNRKKVKMEIQKEINQQENMFLEYINKANEDLIEMAKGYVDENFASEEEKLLMNILHALNNII